jgi:hypothetical protein
MHRQGNQFPLRLSISVEGIIARCWVPGVAFIADGAAQVILGFSTMSDAALVDQQLD